MRVTRGGGCQWMGRVDDPMGIIINYGRLGSVR
eukprot:CAMPEP_0203758910 /NCGR_PEP_ID=MMETSP0098-20131031/11807_1 /ASSEMBLY_ACC=CAM_ASM_000208 /TAXON_ID=96639 /ORGANISM=" , Strain NY0313808BC1" /LENGTH=32 /DNA_ID= /DNA_START= /DNA_END= /DNA_ORIENTATION=